MYFFYITPLLNSLLKNNDNGNTITLIIKSTYSLHYYTLHLSCIHYSSVSRFELTRNAFRWSVFRSAIHQLTSMSTSVRLFSLSLFFFSLFVSWLSSFSSSSVLLLLLSLRLFPLKVFQSYVGRQRKSNTKNVQSKKNEKEPIQHKKRRKHSWEKKMNNGTLESRERELGFYVIPIETDFYGKVYPSLALHAS